MAIFRYQNNVFVLVSLVLLLGGLAAFMYGLLTSMVGFAGLVNHGILGFGILCAGLGLVGFTAFLAFDAIKKLAFEGQPFGQALLAFAKELGALLTNVAGVCIPALFLIVGLVRLLGSEQTAGTRLVAGVILVVSVACLVGFIRWRTRHPRPMDRLGMLAMVLFMLALGTAFMLGGAIEASKFVSDLIVGPRTAVCALSGFDKQVPSGRHAGFQPTTIDLEFTDADGRIISVTVSEHDVDALDSVVNSSAVVELTYYQKSCIFVSLDNKGAALRSDATPQDANPSSGSR